jgi:uncharacterized membrane protein
MEGLAALLIFLCVICFLCGPAALIIALIALSKSNRLDETVRMQRLFGPQEEPAVKPSPAVPVFQEPKPSAPQPAPAAAPKWPTVDLTSPAPRPAIPPAEKPIPPKAAEPAPVPAVRPTTPPSSPGQESLEQRIGTLWILIAGIVTVLFGVIFFLKYAYDHNWLAPWVRVGIIAAGAVVALAVGETTRRRGYEIVAKGTTALGFALLYAAAFSAYRIYGLIDPIPAYVIAVCITIAAMAYAVILDEVLIAFLSLFGGYLTPILLSTGQNLPNPLFTYVLILSLGAMACAYLRWWRAVNIVAFIGTYLLYTAWFEKFYAPSVNRFAQVPPTQMTVALGWLAVFFILYLLMPLLYGLIRKTLSRQEDVWLAALNGLVFFYYLYRILYPDYRAAMAIACAGISGFYLALMFLSRLRCKEDYPLQVSLLITALAFLTVALPLYFRMRALAIGWAVEGTILAGIGVLYRSRWTQAAGLIATALSIVCLFWYLPLHHGDFRLIANPDFGTWLLVCAAILIQHLLYRFLKTGPQEDVQPGPEEKILAGVLYAGSLALLFIGCAMEWHAHCRWNLNLPRYGSPLFFEGMILLITALMLLLTIRPVRPESLLCTLFGIFVSITGAVYTAAVMYQLYNRAFPLFANRGFLFVCLFTAALFVCGWLWYRREDKTYEMGILASAYALGAVVLLCLLLSEQIWVYWDCRNQYAGPIVNWKLKASMYLSILWAVYGAVLMIVGFWKKLAVLRYLALALFALLLAKIFLFDTGTLKTEYRIAAFLVTGLILVAVSYLYQYARKKGLFDSFQTTAEKPKDFFE